MSATKEKCPESLFLAIKCVCTCPCVFVCLYMHVCFLYVCVYVFRYVTPQVEWSGKVLLGGHDTVVKNEKKSNMQKRLGTLFQKQSSEFIMTFKIILNLKITKSSSSPPRAPKAQATCLKLHQPSPELGDGCPP